MPAKTTRKIMKHGTSGVVAIPKDYRDFHNLNHGDEVIVYYDNLILIVPKSEAKRIEADPEKQEIINNFLRGEI